MVTAYLELAELQALNRKPMYMQDWLSRLDEFLKMSGNEILKGAGKISHQKAVEKARNEYEKFNKHYINELSKVEKDFIKQIESTSKKIKGKQ